MMTPTRPLRGRKTRTGSTSSPQTTGLTSATGPRTADTLSHRSRAGASKTEGRADDRNRHSGHPRRSAGRQRSAHAREATMPGRSLTFSGLVPSASLPRPQGRQPRSVHAHEATTPDRSPPFSGHRVTNLRPCRPLAVPLWHSRPLLATDHEATMPGRSPAFSVSRPPDIPLPSGGEKSPNGGSPPRPRHSPRLAEGVPPRPPRQTSLRKSCRRHLRIRLVLRASKTRFSTRRRVKPRVGDRRQASKLWSSLTHWKLLSSSKA